MTEESHEQTPGRLRFSQKIVTRVNPSENSDHWRSSQIWLKHVETKQISTHQPVHSISHMLHGAGI